MFVVIDILFLLRILRFLRFFVCGLLRHVRGVDLRRRRLLLGRGNGSCSDCTVVVDSASCEASVGCNWLAASFGSTSFSVRSSYASSYATSYASYYGSFGTCYSASYSSSYPSFYGSTGVYLLTASGLELPDQCSCSYSYSFGNPCDYGSYSYGSCLETCSENCTIIVLHAMACARGAKHGDGSMDGGDVSQTCVEFSDGEGGGEATHYTVGCFEEDGEVTQVLYTDSSCSNDVIYGTYTLETDAECWCQNSGNNCGCSSYSFDHSLPDCVEDCSANDFQGYFCEETTPSYCAFSLSDGSIVQGATK